MSHNSSTSSSEPAAQAARKFLAAFALAVLLLLLPTILVSLFLQPLNGDVARVAYLSSRDFSAQRAQAPLLAVSSSNRTAAPDILVLGDSFSANNAWQSQVTARTGKRVLTWNYEQVACIDDWIEKAVSGKLRPSARIVIVETVERIFPARFAQPSTCARRWYAPQDIAAGEVDAMRSRWAVFPLNFRHIARSALAYRTVHNAQGRLRWNDAVLVDLQRDGLFSNRLSRRLVYYIDDELKLANWSETKTAAAVTRLASLQARAAARGVTLVFLVVPDKSSVYMPWVAPAQQLPYRDKGERLFALLGEKLGAQYNLLPVLREAAVVNSDLYRPDDTHLSRDGYRVLGAQVATWLPE